MAQAKAKCPVCDWDIKDAGVTVAVNGKKIRVCSEECAEKLRKEAGSKRGR